MTSHTQLNHVNFEQESVSWPSVPAQLPLSGHVQLQQRGHGGGGDGGGQQKWSVCLRQQGGRHQVGDQWSLTIIKQLKCAFVCVYVHAFASKENGSR